MTRKYNFRRRNPDVKWIEDDTLIESESDDETYVTVTETETEEEEEEEYETEEEEEEDQAQTISVPIPKHGRIVIAIDNRGYADEEEYDEEYEGDDDEEEQEGGFINYLAKKYVNSKKKSSESSPSLDLNDEESDYFQDLSKAKQKKLNKKMKQLASLVKDGDVPYKFRVLDLPVSDSVKANVIKKLDALDKMDIDGGESHKLQTWVDGFLRVPFGVNVPLPVQIKDGPKPCAGFLADASSTLDKAVYGMQPAKTQIMQILAQWISNPTSVGNVIALKGPMGVGKTSFAKNGVANVLKRPFEFFSLGGAADSANFVGHAYTYEGSTWGRVADSLMNARCMNPVMYFDELDKVSTTPHGDEIVSMLIHMTDRSQNTQFHDRYFAGVDFDLSQCLFVFSFNDETKVHPILKDRMQVINCSGYTAEEKKNIVLQYVWPQILDRIKLEGLTTNEETIKYLISEHSKDEEGVRTLIRAVETLVTRINLLRIADEATVKALPFYKKIEFPCVVDVALAKHILQEAKPSVNESWTHLYT